MTRTSHPKKEVEAALRHAETRGWRIVQGGSHAWGKIMCPYHDEGCRAGNYCITWVWSTPRDAGDHAKDLRRAIDGCVLHCISNSNKHREGRT